MTHKSEDYKISAVKYYLKNKDNIRKICKIFDCKKSTLQRWIQRYKTSKNITRINRIIFSITLTCKFCSRISYIFLQIIHLKTFEILLRLSLYS